MRTHAHYVGETSRHFGTRVQEHSGISARTGATIQGDINSKVLAHARDSGHKVEPRHFSIVSCAENVYDLKIKESLYIRDLKPSLNVAQSSVPLLLF